MLGLCNRYLLIIVEIVVCYNGLANTHLADLNVERVRTLLKAIVSSGGEGT